MLEDFFSAELAHKIALLYTDESLLDILKIIAVILIVIL